MTKGARACISCEVITEGLLRPEVGAEVFPSDGVGKVVLVDRCLTERHESGEKFFELGAEPLLRGRGRAYREQIAVESLSCNVAHGVFIELSVSS